MKRAIRTLIILTLIFVLMVVFTGCKNYSEDITLNYNAKEISVYTEKAFVASIDVQIKDGEQMKEKCLPFVRLSIGENSFNISKFYIANQSTNDAKITGVIVSDVSFEFFSMIILGVFAILFSFGFLIYWFVQIKVRKKWVKAS